MIVYIVEDTLHLIYKDKSITVKTTNCIQNGYIINKEIFMQEFVKIMKKEKIKNKLFGDSITFVDNGYFTVGELYFIENIFTEIGFIRVDFLDIRQLLPMEDCTYVEINDSYIVLYLDNTIYLDLSYFKDLPKILDYFRAYLTSNVVFFGINKCIPKIHLNDVHVYYVENYTNYITLSLLKVKKYGA